MPSGMLVALSLLTALVLALLPMPAWTVWLRPDWILMVLIFWAIFSPEHVGVTLAWAMGMLLDLLSGALLGEHAFAYVIVIYLISRMYIRLRVFSFLQQSLSVFMFVLLAQIIVFCVQGFIGELPASQLYWMASLTSMLLWPWLFVLMRDMTKRSNTA